MIQQNQLVSLPEMNLLDQIPQNYSPDGSIGCSEIKSINASYETCIMSNSTANTNVVIQSNSVLTIPSGLLLKIDFTHNHLLVNSGSGVLIQPGAKITN